MPDYLRYRVAGGTYFFTVNLLERKNDLLVRHVDALRDAVFRVREARPFHIDAWVVLPDHMHCIWTLPEGDVDYSGRWKAIKIRFAKALPPTEYRSRVRRARSERAIWQRRFSAIAPALLFIRCALALRGSGPRASMHSWEHTIRNDNDYRRHIEYCYINPVKHGYVTRVRDWPHSSFHRDVQNELFPEDWAGGGEDIPSIE